MKIFVFYLQIFLFSISISVKANHPDSVYLFAYSVNEGRSGLTLAWSIDEKSWHAIGPEHTFLFSDFGTWGTQKRMFSPFLFQDTGGMWHCVWSLNDTVHQFAHAASENLYEWKRQSYPMVMSEGNIQNPEVSWGDGAFRITWESKGEQEEGYFQVTTYDFKNYSETKPISETERSDQRETVKIDGIKRTGMVYKVNWNLVAGLIKHQEWTKFHNQERAEIMADDPVRFKDLELLEAEITLKPEEAKGISDMLIGIFFEDISYAADGGLYAELVQNRDFEYQLGDRNFRDTTWTPKKSWAVEGNTTFDIRTDDPIHPNNTYYAALDIAETGAKLINEGWDGIPVEKDKIYDFSLFARIPDNGKGSVLIRLRNENGMVVGESRIKKIEGTWKKHTALIKASETSANAKLEIVPEFTGIIDLDMISLFPQHTFKNRKNGLRADLAQAIADLKPRFIRFPGGCVAHGDGIANMYRWENTIGPLESRVPQKNIWRYHQTAGLGYYEYFQFCEDIGAEPIPVVPAGVPCQNSATGGHGQQCGIPMDEMDEYTQSVLNLIEWANGDKHTDWGKKRADAGHPEPFNLKYVGVGNEDLITDVFEERFTMIYNAVREKYPEIIVIGTVGPFYMGTDYEEGWDLAKRLQIPVVDEHYYQPPGWFINNQDFYDKYDRNGSKVYLGEYAAHVRGRRLNIETALSEALYLTAVERNGDVVSMTSYAPLLAKEDHTSWNPDLIYFNNTEVKPTVDYYVQKLYGHNAGTLYIPSEVKLSNHEQSVKRRFGISVVWDDATGDLILKLANLLPVDINTSIDLSDYKIYGEGKLSVLQGEPADENTKPVEKDIQVSENLNYQVPGYSFSVIRLKVE
jgi:alpha-L-arabinofuranosidase